MHGTKGQARAYLSSELLNQDVLVDIGRDV